jgi:endonuclease/exonuclease/phosphatase family metal-dependent hydrolase
MLNLIFDKVREIGLPALLTGDYHTRENTESYNLCLKLFDDAKFVAANTDTGYTWHGYDDEKFINNEKYLRYGDSPIDYCMCSKDMFDVESYKIIRAKSSDGQPISDHYPVIAKLTLK